MKVCPKCWRYNDDTSEKCIGCGESLVNIETINSVQYQNQTENSKVENKVNSVQNEPREWIGIDMDEIIVAKLGNGYFQNLITTGDVSKVNAILTQKRLYLSGKSYDISVSKGILTSFRISKVINIEDVTGTGFVYINNIKFIFFAILFFLAALITMMSYTNLALIFILISIALVIAFYINKKSIFKIEYAGGSVGFDVKWLNVNESIIFQKKIYQVKDQRKKEIIQESLKEKENT